MTVEVLSECSLFMDVAPDEAVAPGDWIRTGAGGRYLVLTARRVQRRKHFQQARYQMRVGRLPRDCEIPSDVKVWLLRWYKRQPVTVRRPVQEPHTER